MAAFHTSEAEPQFDQTAPPRRVHVLLPLPLASAYDYAVAEDEPIEVGDFVAVPLGRRTVTGVVWGEGSADPDNAVADSRLRPIAQRLPVPAMDSVTRRFVEWLADYTCAAPGAVLRMTMSVPAAFEAPRPRLAYALAGPAPDRMTGARHRVMEVLADGQAMPAATIAELAAVSTAVVRGLVKHGTLHEVQLPAELPVPEPDWQKAGETLSDDQLAAAAALRAKVEAGGYSTTLLDGVTGAGKTEVYLEAVAAS
jgi:primosomal protein N' (replication factor Y)